MAGIAPLYQPRIAGLCRRVAQTMARHHPFTQPLTAYPGVAGDQPDRYMVDMKARAHGLVENAQTQADTFAVEQAGKGADQPAQVLHKGPLPG
ncbi:hypothetical protein D3C84_830340 [compost metagenome]